MKNLYLGIILFIANLSFGQTLYQESFETNTNGTNYNTSIAEFSDGDGDFFTRTDGANITGGYEVSNMDGSFYFAGMDIDGEGATLPVELSTISIDVTGLTSIDFSVLLAEDDDGTNEDWDDSDYLNITYSVDGGVEQNLIWVRNDGTQYNTAPLIDTDFDGVGDGPEITSTFTEYMENIALSGATSIQFFLETNLGAGDEDIAFDNIVVTDVSPAGPTISASPTLLTDFVQFVGNPSDEQTFEVSGTNLTGDISLDVTAGDYQISETSGGTFGTTITLTESAGEVAATTIYVRLNGGTPASPSNGTIELTSASATTVEVQLEGDIYSTDPIIFVSLTSLTGFSHFVGTPSAEQTFEVSAEYLTTDLVVTAPAEYEVSLSSGTGFGPTATIAYTDGSVAATDIYVRLNGTSENSTQNGDIVVSSTGASDKIVTLEGETFDYTLYPIGEVTTNDADGVADSLDVYVELRGIVHCSDFDGNEGYNFTIIDGKEDGINVFNFNDVDAYTAVEGDSIGVKGYIDQYNGLTQVFAEGIELFTQSNTTVTPLIVTSLDESTESQLITLENLSLVNSETTWPSGGSVDVTDESTVFTVFVPSGSPLANGNTPGGAFNLIGIGGQFDSSSPFNTGYQVVPCSITELCDVNTATTVNEATITATEVGLDYKWVDCNDNYAVIPGQLSQSFTASENGSYAVIITDGACSDTSECTEINTIGLSSNDLSQIVSLYPNPVSNELNINSNNAEILCVEVFNATGKSIYSDRLNSVGTTISTSNWESGVYFVNIRTNNGIANLKVVK